MAHSFPGNNARLFMQSLPHHRAKTDIMFEDETQVPTDSEQSDESDARAATPSPGRELDTEADCQYEEQLIRSEPLMLAMDGDDRIQVVQGMSVISIESLERASGYLQAQSLVPKRTLPQRPPGVFFKPPPGLQLSEHAVMSKPKLGSF
eukprot:TRINITY_DN8753_c0_g1_i1.p1 TRINITY_DN8753_c0_g1~~TRINITY_DN8753_c0_g1_i1.p1  ORF type:complete len:149 (-),score=30.45 TRINITY_DN8753_c0_g1_i1:717-1163(-)